MKPTIGSIVTFLAPVGHPLRPRDEDPEGVPAVVTKVDGETVNLRAFADVEVLDSMLCGGQAHDTSLGVNAANALLAGALSDVPYGDTPGRWWWPMPPGPSDGIPVHILDRLADDAPPRDAEVLADRVHAFLTARPDFAFTQEEIVAGVEDVPMEFVAKDYDGGYAVTLQLLVRSGHARHAKVHGIAYYAAVRSP